MRIVKTDSKLPYYIQVETTFEEYENLVVWIKENVPTIDRFTPDWNPRRQHDTQKLRFRFRYEEHAMAFKLILSWSVR